jgi:hypothetical protein
VRRQARIIFGFEDLLTIYDSGLMILSSEQKAQECDAIKADSSNAVGFKIKNNN